MSYPDWHPNAITFTPAAGQRAAFTIPANPTDIVNRQGAIQTNMPTLDGIVTYDWTKELVTITHTGITGVEGVAPWLAFRRDFLGQRAGYTNALTRESFTVKVTRVDLEAHSRNPANWRWTIEVQESQALVGTVQ
jgi:hypothetical protein